MDKSPDKELVLCNGCAKRRVRIATGERYSDGKRKFTDARGRAWQARRCPDCRFDFNRQYPRYAVGR